MYTSDENNDMKSVLIYCSVTLFIAIFGAVYELFSHNVYSYFMIYAFAVPLILGVLPTLIFMNFKKYRPGQLSTIPWNCGVAALTIGSLFQGVLDIYGTTNKLIIIYPILGITLLAVGIGSYFKKNPAES